MIYVGDCHEVLDRLEADSFDSIVTDPPYHLTNSSGGPQGKGLATPYARARAGASSRGFMGKAWDGGDVAFQPETWAKALRVAKPGAFLAAFGGTRTFHRLACAIEDAGWELRDTLMWVYGSGFPKSHNGPWGGTALKPAWEPIILARKPLVRTVAQTFEVYGTGGLNIDACRVPGEQMPPNTGAGGLPRRTVDEHRGAGTVAQPHDLGRWPANVLHDGSAEVLAAFPTAPGQQADASLDPGARRTRNTYGEMRRGRSAEASANSENDGTVGFKMRPGARRIDTGSAARFFYCAKADRADRDHGCDSLPRVQAGFLSNTSGQHMTRRDGGAPGDCGNNHPTVKPTDLMRWLCRLVTPPGGEVLDPFAGSGSTGRGAVAEGMRFTGIELDPAYAAIAEARIRATQPGLSLDIGACA